MTFQLDIDNGSWTNRCLLPKKKRVLGVGVLGRHVKRDKTISVPSKAAFIPTYLVQFKPTMVHLIVWFGPPIVLKYKVPFFSFVFCHSIFISKKVINITC